jgi:hypothetical protein
MTDDGGNTQVSWARIAEETIRAAGYAVLPAEMRSLGEAIARAAMREALKPCRHVRVGGVCYDCQVERLLALE